MQVRSGSVPCCAVVPTLVHTVALRAMEMVASHINEMQKVFEDFGPVFDLLAAEQTGPHRQVQAHSPHWNLLALIAVFRLVDPLAPA